MKRYGWYFIISLALVVIFLQPCFLAAQNKTAPALKKYEARYHIIYTDLPTEKVCESIARVNAMAEEYHSRTKGFGGKITEKLPFYLYGNYEDYMFAREGKGMGSAGVYTGKELRAVADDRLASWEKVWKVVQHEGFHQFAHMVICHGRGSLPVWLNEGLAEYFGDAIWTGDNMVAGLIDAGATWREGNKIYTRQGRLQRVQEEIKDGEFISFEKIVDMSSDEWNAELMTSANYDQAWSMVHFFVHGRGGKYRKPLQRYLGDMVNGKSSLKMFKRRFGYNLKDLEADYRKWWLSLDDNPTADLYDRAMVEILTSFMARANVRKIRFSTAEEFFDLANKGELYLDVRKDKSLWLPNSLLGRALKAAKSYNKWEIKTGRGYRPILKLYRSDGTVFTGSFTLERKNKIGKISVQQVQPQKR